MTDADTRTRARRRPSLKDHSRSALRALFVERGWSAYRADQVASWLYQQDATELEQMTNLPASLRGEIAAEFALETLEVEAAQHSVDGTQKLLLRAFDGARIEAVLIPEERRHTLCVSTQVGCPLTCSFCATGALGFTRNLSAGEIVDQVLHARRRIPAGEALTNLVFMGMGEPLLNLPNVSEAIRILVDPKGLALAPRRITVSTAGVLPQIGALLAVAPIHLAVSLHATTDEVRDVLVPLNKKFPLAELMATLRSEPQLGRRRPVFFEYTLMDGVNDSLEDARRMPRLIAGIPAKVNVIPMNPHADAPYRPPPPAVVDRFTAALHEAGLRVTLRRDRGRDIDAACGQLANRAAAPESLQEGLAETDGTGGKPVPHTRRSRRMLYAIGDIHGELEKLDELLELLPLEPGDKLIFLGDYIDRGPDSPGVIERLIELRERHACVFLLGNHESMFLDFLGWTDDAYFGGDAFLMNGGDRTLAAYGYFDREDTDRESFSLPKSHEDFLLSLRLSHAEGDYLFVHAGISQSQLRSGDLAYALRKSRPEDLLWNRTSGDLPHDLGVTMVYGHTPNEDFGVRWNTPFSIGVDTGAVYGGPLTAIRLPDEKVFQA